MEIEIDLRLCLSVFLSLFLYIYIYIYISFVTFYKISIVNDKTFMINKKILVNLLNITKKVTNSSKLYFLCGGWSISHNGFGENKTLTGGCTINHTNNMNNPDKKKFHNNENIKQIIFI